MLHRGLSIGCSSFREHRYLYMAPVGAVGKPCSNSSSSSDPGAHRAGSHCTPPFHFIFLPFLKSVFPKAPPAELLGSAIPHGSAVGASRSWAELSVSSMEQPRPRSAPRPYGTPPMPGHWHSEASASAGSHTLLLASTLHSVLYFQGINTAGDDWRSLLALSKRPTGRSGITRPELRAPGTSSPQRTR